MRVPTAIWVVIAIAALAVIAPKIFGLLLILLFGVGVLALMFRKPRSDSVCQYCGRKHCRH